MDVVNLFKVGILATGRHVQGHVEVDRQAVQYSVWYTSMVTMYL
jgi:hypothetical protein